MAWSPRVSTAAPEVPTARGHRIDPRHRVAVETGRPRPSRRAGCRGSATRSCRRGSGWSRSGSNRMVASTMTPVSPIPPTVAQNRSARSPGEHSTTLPSASSSARRVDVRPERPVDVVVLAVDVAGDRPADGDEAGPRRDGHEEARGHEDAQQLVEADAAPAPYRGRCRVEHDGLVGVVCSRSTSRRRSAPGRRTNDRAHGRMMPRAGQRRIIARRDRSRRGSTTVADRRRVRPQPVSAVDGSSPRTPALRQYGHSGRVAERRVEPPVPERQANLEPNVADEPSAAGRAAGWHSSSVPIPLPRSSR